MNFFAHYYFHHQPGNHWFNAGLLFPDLLRIFTRQQRISENKFLEKNSSQTELSDGIKRHFIDDEKFHNWYWFKETNHKLALEIRNSQLNFKRDWILAHILIELAIDHILVNEHEQKVSQLYEDLSKCDKTHWAVFFNQIGLNEADEWYEGYQKFISYRYIFTYKETKHVIYALQRICERTGIGQFNDLQNGFLLVLLNTFIPELKLKLIELETILE